jgi:hypothetical protein
LSTHYRIHTRIKPFSCDTSEKAFSDGSGLAYHNRIHTDIKPYLSETDIKEEINEEERAEDSGSNQQDIGKFIKIMKNTKIGT